MSVIEDLKAARRHVERGWCKGQIGDSYGNVCAMGAVSLAAGMSLGTQVDHSSSEWDRHLAQYDALLGHVPEGFGEVSEYNDAPKTTKEDVLALFDKALAELGGLAA